MSKEITLKLNEKDYDKIFKSAKVEKRSISNFIITHVLRNIDESCYTDAIETSQIMADKNLLQKLRAGHADAQQRKGRSLG